MYCWFQTKMCARKQGDFDEYLFVRQLNFEIEAVKSRFVKRNRTNFVVFLAKVMSWRD